MVQIYGTAQGFGDGLQRGTDIAESRTRREALKKEQINELVKNSVASADLLLKEGVNFISQSPNRTNPNFDPAVQAYKQPIEETAAMLEKLNDPDAQAIAQNLRQRANVAFQHAQTQSETYSSKVEGEHAGKMAFINSLGGQGQPSPLAQPQATQPQAMQQGVDIGMPSEVGPQAAMPSTSPFQQAQAQPSMMPAAPEAAPSAPSAPPPQQVAQASPNDEQAMIRKRAIEAMFPPTIEEQKMTEGKVKRFIELEEKATSAVGLSEQLREARKMLDEGIYTGFGADWKLKASKMANYDEEMVRRTEYFQSIMARQIGPQLKAFGSGSGVSDRDVMVVEQFIGKDISLNPDAIRDILSLGERVVAREVGNFNKVAPPGSQIQLPEAAQAPTGAGPQGGGGFTAGPDGWVPLAPNVKMRQVQ